MSKTDYGIYTYSTGYFFADRQRETFGDYHKIGVVFFNPLKIHIYDNSPRYADVHAAIQQTYQKLKDSDQDHVQVSATGQTVKLGK
jgi:hypothetical protein